MNCGMRMGHKHMYEFRRKDFCIMTVTAAAVWQLLPGGAIY